MVSSRRTGTNENISTYDSAGGADYTALATWEAVVDVDTTATGTATTEVLEVADGAHDDIAIISGGTHDESYPLIIRAAPGAENRGSKTSGARFESTATASPVFNVSAAFVYFFDLGITYTLNSVSTLGAFNMSATNSILGNIHLYDLTNSGAGDAIAVVGQASSGDSTYVNMLMNSVGLRGFSMNTSSTGNRVYNCTIRGFTSFGVNFSAGDCVVKNTSATDPATLCYNGSYAATSTNNNASDTSTPGSNPLNSLTPSFVSADDLHLLPGDTVAKGAGVNLSADSVFPFNDDIDGQERGLIWDIGGDQVTPAETVLLSWDADRTKTLAIESSGSFSDVLSMGSLGLQYPYSVGVVAPATLTGTVTIQVATNAQGPFVPLNKGGNDIIVAASKSVTLESFLFPYMRLVSSSSEGSTRNFQIIAHKG